MNINILINNEVKFNHNFFLLFYFLELLIFKNVKNIKTTLKK